MAEMPKIFVRKHQRRWLRREPDMPHMSPVSGMNDDENLPHTEAEIEAFDEEQKKELADQKAKDDAEIAIHQADVAVAERKAKDEEEEKKRADFAERTQVKQADEADTVVYKEESKLTKLRKSIKAHQQETRMTKTEKANLKLKQEQADQLEQTVKAQKRAAAGQRAEAKRAKANADQQAAQARIAEEQLKREKLQTKQAKLEAEEKERAQREKLRDQKKALKEKHRAEKKAKKAKSHKSKKKRSFFSRRRGGPRRKMTPQGRAYLSRKIKQNRREGYSQRQSVAIAFNQTREAGYYVPPRRQ